MIDTEKFQTMERIAEKLYRGGVFSAEVKSADTAFAIILAGDEMGYEPMAAARAFALVKGKVSLSADALVGLVKRSGQCAAWRVVETTAAECTITTTRVGDDEPTVLTYTIAMAQRAGLTGSGTWRAHPEAMLRARCGAALARAVYPDVCGGLYEPDEAEEILRNDRSGPKAVAKKAEPAGEEPKREPTPAAIPEALAAFHAALPSLATPADGAALWLAHRPALNAAAEPHRKAAFNELAKALTKFGGGVGSFSAAKGYLKTSLADHDEKAKAAASTPAAEPAAPQAAPVEPAPAAEAHTPAESPGAEPEPAPEAQHPAVVAFLAAVAAIELPGEGVAAWMKHRAALAPLPVGDREGAWKALVARVEVVGRMTNASAWLKKAVQTADAEAQAVDAASEPAGLPADVMDGLLADIGMARNATVLATTWAAIAEGEWHDATPAQRVKLETARTAREKALRTPPTPPKGTRTRATAAPADATGSGGEPAANDGAGATMSTADRWRAHLAAKPWTGKHRGAGGVAASWVKHRDELTEAGARAECLAITIDELAARGVTEPGAWIDGVREHLAAKAA